MSDASSPTLGYEAEVEQLDAALAAFESGAGAYVAVLSEPWGGRDRLLDRAETQVDAPVKRVRISPTFEERPAVDWSASDVFLVDDCQHLYQRKIGGFEVLDDFLRTVAGFDGLVVTSWNVFSWRYLQAIKNLDRIFTSHIEVPKLDWEEVAALVTSEYDGDPPKYVTSDDTEQERLIERVDFSLEPWGSRTFVVPFPWLNREELHRRVVASGDSDAERQAFDKITRLANGNPGAARRIWEGSIDDGRIEVSSIPEPTAEFEFDYETEFLLQEVLTKEQVPIAELVEVVDHPDVERALGSLSRDGVLTVTDDTVELSPTAVHPVIEELVRRRILW